MSNYSLTPDAANASVLSDDFFSNIWGSVNEVYDTVVETGEKLVPGVVDTINKRIDEVPTEVSKEIDRQIDNVLYPSTHVEPTPLPLNPKDIVSVNPTVVKTTNTPVTSQIAGYLDHEYAPYVGAIAASATAKYGFKQGWGVSLASGLAGYFLPYLLKKVI